MFVIIILIVIGLLVAIGSRGNVARNEEDQDEKYRKLLDQSLEEMEHPKTVYSSASFDDDGVIGKAVRRLAARHNMYGDGKNGVFSTNKELIWYRSQVRNALVFGMKLKGNADNSVRMIKSELSLFKRVCRKYPECCYFRLRILQLGNGLFQQGYLSRQELQIYYNKSMRFSHNDLYKSYKENFDDMKYRIH